jgi:uncharacterized protein with FMN-binding domain
MRRVILAITLTIIGLVLLLSYRTPNPATSAGALAGTESSGAGNDSSGAGNDSSGAGTTTSTGTAVNTPYGPVQVEVTLRDGAIVDAKAVQAPDANPHDVQISHFALPRLRQETLDAQSAQIDVVSGATYTSEGYITSLQSALDRAGGQR